MLNSAFFCENAFNSFYQFKSAAIFSRFGVWRWHEEDVYVGVWVCVLISVRLYKDQKTWVVLSDFRELGS